MTMRKLLLILFLLSLFPLATSAAPTSWNYASSILEPLQSQWSALIKGSYFQATSTTQASIFPYASTTALSTTSLCLTGDLPCKTAWPTGSGSGSGTVSTSTNETAGFLPYWTSTSATPALLGKVATTTLTAGTNVTFTGTPGYLIGGTNLTINATGGSGFGTVSTSTIPTVGNLSYWTSAGYPSLLGTVATSTLSLGSDFTTSGTAGFIVGGSGYTINCRASSGSQSGCLSSTDWTTFNSKGSGTVTSVTATAPIFSSGGATPNITWAGLATTTQPSSSNLLVSNGGAGVFGVATTTMTASSPLSLSNTVVKVGGSNSVLTLDTSGAWSGNAGTATALAGNGANCTAGNYPLGVNASGAVEDCTAAGAGTVTSVAMTVPTGLTISGSPITTSGTLALTLTSGYNIPLTASTTNWNTFYDTPSNRITDGTGLTWSSNTLNCDTASGSVQGCLSSTDWTTFNSKGSGTVTSIATTYPLTGGTITTTGTLALAFGTTTSNTWAGTQTFTNAPVLSTLSGLIAGNSGALYQVASSSLFGFTPQTNQLAKGNFLVGNDAGVAQATSSIFISSTGNVGIGTTSPVTLAQLFSTGTTTISIDSNSATKGGCIEIKDKSGTGYTYLYAEDGVLFSSTISCK